MISHTRIGAHRTDPFAGCHPAYRDTMKLTTKQKQFLRGEAHHLNPVVLLGQHGLTDAVMAEIDLALTTHELIKVRVPGQDREDKKTIIEQISETTGAELVQTVGHIAVLYRPHPEEQRLVLPKATKSSAG